MENGEFDLAAEEFRNFRDYLKEIAGIDLGDNKQYLVTTRLRKVLADYRCTSLADLTAQIKQTHNQKMRQKVVDMMTTNETFWFRDNYPFDYLKSTLLPELARDPSRNRIRIWSAACSSGQEPLSLSMAVEECAREHFSLRNIEVEIIATDISNDILVRAKTYTYDRLSISRGLSGERLKLFFEESEGNSWRAKSVITNRIHYWPLNLQDNFLSLGMFDIIFCRNVLIYFSAELKKDVLRRIHSLFERQGSLFLGSSESLSGAAKYYEMVHCNPGVMYRTK